MPEQREGGLLQLLGDHTPPKHQLRGSLLPAHTLSHTQQTQHTLAQQFQHTHAHQHQINPDWIVSTAPSASPANPADSEPARELAGASRSLLLDPTQPFSRTATRSPSPQRSLTPDLQLPVVTDASILNLTSLSRYGSFSCVVDLIMRLHQKYCTLCIGWGKVHTLWYCDILCNIIYVYNTIIMLPQ